jgi:DNA processing protein
MKSDFYLFFFYKLKGLGLNKICELIKQFGGAQNLYQTKLDNKAGQIIQKYKNDKIWLDKIKEEFNNLKDQYISIEDPDYPDLLKQIYDPPLFLFYKGNKKLLSSQYILTIVGSRQTTSYHRQATTKIINQLQTTPLIIASGLAIGIDTFSHALALENNLPTIAVLGSSLDKSRLYPQCNIKLAEEIISNNGLLISEYPKHTKTQLHHFPKRNRILAGLSKVVIVISGAKKSGTLITAQVSIDEGREVLALPGNINQTLNQGPNHLINNGAQILLSANDILKIYNLNNITNKTESIKFSNSNTANIYKILKLEPQTIEKLAFRLKLTQEVINISISELELQGLANLNQLNQIEII